MIEFFPWSKKLLYNSFNNYVETKQLQLLDIELGGSCNFKCVYCDTPKYGHQIKYKIKDLEFFFDKGKPLFVYICGLGEPTVNINRINLIEVLELCRKYNVRCCIFTNLSVIDEDLYTYIDEEILYPIFKLDSFSIDTIKQIYNVSDELANKQINNINNIIKHVKVNSGYTNIAASIVPSTLNISEIKLLIKWCYQNNVFPLIGQLEDAGKGHNVFGSLEVTESMLIDLKDYILNCYGEPYEIPICPSVLFGVHINFEGEIIVDGASGLSCHWFWLTEPHIEKLGQFVGYDINSISQMIIEKRKIHAEKIKKIFHMQKELIFGGCGGDIKHLLDFYISNML